MVCLRGPITASRRFQRSRGPRDILSTTRTQIVSLAIDSLHANRLLNGNGRDLKTSCKCNIFKKKQKRYDCNGGRYQIQSLLKSTTSLFVGIQGVIDSSVSFADWE